MSGSLREKNRKKEHKLTRKCIKRERGEENASEEKRIYNK